MDVDNWKSDMKYLVPGYAKVVVAVGKRYPDHLKSQFGSVFKQFQMMLQDFSLEEHACDYIASLSEIYSLSEIADPLKESMTLIFNRVSMYK